MLFHTPLPQILNTVKKVLQSLLMPLHRALLIEINKDVIDILLWFPYCAAVEVFTY
jgi:hypothetical protein